MNIQRKLDKHVNDLFAQNTHCHWPCHFEERPSLSNLRSINPNEHPISGIYPIKSIKQPECVSSGCTRTGVAAKPHAQPSGENNSNIINDIYTQTHTNHYNKPKPPTIAYYIRSFPECLCASANIAQYKFECLSPT